MQVRLLRNPPPSYWALCAWNSKDQGYVCRGRFCVYRGLLFRLLHHVPCRLALLVVMQTQCATQGAAASAAAPRLLAGAAPG